MTCVLMQPCVRLVLIVCAVVFHTQYLVYIRRTRFFRTLAAPHDIQPVSQYALGFGFDVSLFISAAGVRIRVVCTEFCSGEQR